MKFEKFAELYVTSLMNSRANSAVRINELLRTVSLGYVALSVPMLFVDQLPSNFRAFLWALIIIMAIGLLGLILEFVQYFISTKGITENLIKIQHYVISAEKFDAKEFMDLDSNLRFYHTAILTSRVFLALIGGLILLTCLVIWASRI